MARNGSGWIEGDNLHYINAFGVEVSIPGSSVGATGGTGRPGSAWVEGTYLHWINEDDDEEFRIQGTLQTAGSYRDGSGWVQNYDLAYVDDFGDIRYYDAPCASVYSGLTSATAGVVTEICSGAGGDCDGSGGQVSATWSADEACPAEHMKLELSVNGGSYSTKCDNAAACDDCSDSVYYHTLAGPLAVYSSSGTCNGDCDLSCVSEYYKWRVTREDDTGHTQCDQIVTSNTSTYYTCECSDCSSGGPA
jgi:hypothetical protein